MESVTVQMPREIAKAFKEVELAAIEAQEKHGELTTDMVRACAILTREVAEATNEALLMTAPQRVQYMPGAHEMLVLECKVKMRAELAQVAQLAITMMINLEEAPSGRIIES